ncbi:hypothetical protein C1637_11925 [Chryseobacterium lactis]|uniref:WD40 repeat domain-containing protein n=1 Tax=Chryseobacterium lactis TaxID=1241981 RepID=A0A3G6RV57_CHRLC|nr:hypothetical protein [Chryseobacterium lactis]AZA80764.1 hypothetical protein EG342_02015 [Chryseobacterium lactis]AZB05766.1 hypothetical protein EG341_18140 [Chryseobacterium lactis]PNW13515.1 hypothetical protein C1637_11925 [Chryseobacterium lactis]
MYDTKIQKEWFSEGEHYAIEVNKMIEFGEKNGWENWQGEEPQDTRENLSPEVFELLKTANKNGDTKRFREHFPPAHGPIIPLLKDKSQSIEHLHFINDQKMVFITGTSYEKRQAYLLDHDVVALLDENINAIGKSKQGNIFAIAKNNKIEIYKGWDGDLINEFELDENPDFGITEMTPFNDGSRILIVSSEGIYLLSNNEKKLIHPLNEDNDEEWTSQIDMENAALSHDNSYIAVGDQGYDHRILDAEGNTLGTIGPQSSYPHFCLFAKDDSQLITNSCHFYNGITIGINSNQFVGADIEAYTESDDFTLIDEEMRVYTGVATKDYYILGDAYGYIKAFDKNGNRLWRHFLGSTISGMTLSDDEQTLWVGAHSGILHKLQLGKGLRDTHTIGNTDHYEEFRLLIWKDEPQIWKW